MIKKRPRRTYYIFLLWANIPIREDLSELPVMLGRRNGMKPFYNVLNIRRNEIRWNAESSRIVTNYFLRREFWVSLQQITLWASCVVALLTSLRVAPKSTSPGFIITSSNVDRDVVWYLVQILQISWRVRQWKSFENRSTFDEVLTISVAHLFDSYCRSKTWSRITNIPIKTFYSDSELWWPTALDTAHYLRRRD